MEAEKSGERERGGVRERESNEIEYRVNLQVYVTVYYRCEKGYSQR